LTRLNAAQNARHALPQGAGVDGGAPFLDCDGRGGELLK